MSLKYSFVFLPFPDPWG